MFVYTKFILNLYYRVFSNQKNGFYSRSYENAHMFPLLLYAKRCGARVRGSPLDSRHNWIQGLGFRVQGLLFRVYGFRV